MKDAIALGATLYVPASRPDLAAIAAGRHPNLRSAVICLEDSIHSRDVPAALANLADLLAGLSGGGGRRPALFVRPRDEHMLAHILTLAGVGQLTGFVIPKATPDNLPHWFHALGESAHLVMPTLEHPQLLDGHELARLREQLLAHQPRILAVRIGGNDLIQAIGARRSALRTAYDGPLGDMIARFVTALAPWGFSLSAPVFEHFENRALLREEVERDLEFGLLTKTAIHPCQLDVIQGAYAVDPACLAEAEAMLAATGRAVFASRGAMCEAETHRSWARSIVRRAELFGLKGVRPAASAVD